MHVAIGCGAGCEIDAGGVDHHIAEIAACRDVFEGRADALAQLACRQAAAHGQPDIRDYFRHGVEYRRRDGKVPEAVAGNVDEEVQLSGS